jgi:hypothetical protein
MHSAQTDHRWLRDWEINLNLAPDIQATFGWRWHEWHHKHSGLVATQAPLFVLSLLSVVPLSLAHSRSSANSFPARRTGQNFVEWSESWLSPLGGSADLRCSRPVREVQVRTSLAVLSGQHGQRPTLLASPARAASRGRQDLALAAEADAHWHWHGRATTSKLLS